MSERSEIHDTVAYATKWRCGHRGTRRVDQ
jgi:hypothetical protein